MQAMKVSRRGRGRQFQFTHEKTSAVEFVWTVTVARSIPLYTHRVRRVLAKQTLELHMCDGKLLSLSTVYIPVFVFGRPLLAVVEMLWEG